MNLIARMPDVVAHCEADDWTFAPRYTDGVCPLCGWRPVGVDARPPWLATVDWFVPAMITMVLVSVVMGIVVFVAYSR